MTKDTIIRAAHGKEQPYFMALRSVAQNKALSYTALGLLMNLLSRPNGWKVIPEELVREGAGRSTVYTILEELVNAGHIERNRTRTKGEDGVWRSVTEYIVHESPRLLESGPLDSRNQEGALESTRLDSSPLDVLDSTDPKENTKDKPPSAAASEPEETDAAASSSSGSLAVIPEKPKSPVTPPSFSKATAERVNPEEDIKPLKPVPALFLNLSEIYRTGYGNHNVSKAGAALMKKQAEHYTENAEYAKWLDERIARTVREARSSTDRLPKANVLYSLIAGSWWDEWAKVVAASKPPETAPVSLSSEDILSVIRYA